MDKLKREWITARPTLGLLNPKVLLLNKLNEIVDWINAHDELDAGSRKLIEEAEGPGADGEAIGRYVT